MNSDKPGEFSNQPSQRSQAHLVSGSVGKVHVGDDPLTPEGDNTGSNQDVQRARQHNSTIHHHTASLNQPIPVQNGQRSGGTPPEGGRPNSKENAKVHPVMGNPQQMMPQQQMGPGQMMPQQMGPGQMMPGQMQMGPGQMVHPNQMMMMNNGMNQQQRMPGQPGQMMPGQMPGQPNQMMPGQMPGQPGQFMTPGQPQQFGRPQLPQQQPGFNNRPMGPNQNLQNFNTMNRFQGNNLAMQNMKANDQNDGAYASTQVCSGECTGCLATYLPCCCCCFEKPYKIVPEGYAGVILRFGKLHATVGPGMHYVLPEVDKLVLINKKEIVVDMKAQTVMSKDNTNFRLDSVLYFKMVNTLVTSFSINNLSFALQELAATAIRNAVGGMTIQQFLQQKEHFADLIEAEIEPVAATWGAKVLRVLVQDVYLPPDFQNTFSTSAVAKKISEAQVITSKAEVEVARLMRDAADALSTDAAFQIRYIDALEAIQKSSNPKMIFFPSDYQDVGKSNDHLVNDLIEETHGLLKKH